MDVKRSAALILSSDPMTAALVGAVIEAAGAPPLFPRADEAPRDALRRTRPAIVAVDCEHEDACSEAFLGPAVMVGAAVALFGPARRARELVSAGRRFGIPALCFPDDVELLVALVRRALDGDGEP